MPSALAQDKNPYRCRVQLKIRRERHISTIQLQKVKSLSNIQSYISLIMNKSFGHDVKQTSTTRQCDNKQFKILFF